MSLTPEERAGVSERLAEVKAIMQSLGQAPYSLRAEHLDRWFELFDERARLKSSLEEDDLA